jgi:hypothetical protein
VFGGSKNFLGEDWGAKLSFEPCGIFKRKAIGRVEWRRGGG